MGMSTHIVGFRPPNSKWKEMKVIYDACEKAGVATPDEVDEFFNYEEPDEAGVMIELEGQSCVVDWSDEGRDGFQVDVSKLPKDIKYIRFYNSW